MTKKQLLLESAISLFAENGIEETSVQQITDRAGMSKGAFYLNFKSKEELIIDVIEYFMRNIITEIDRAVRSEQNVNKKLYTYFEATFLNITQYNGFAHVFFTETLPKLGEDFINRAILFESLLDDTLKNILSEKYGSLVDESIYDLIFHVKGLTKNLIQLFFNNHQVNIEKLAHSLVEKTDILAQHSKILYFDQTIMPPNPQIQFVEKNELIEQLEQLQTIVTNTIGVDSINILLEELQGDSPKIAIIQGMMHNLSDIKEAKWVHFLLRSYIKQSQK